MEFSPVTKEYADILYSWNQEVKAQLYNPFEKQTVEEHWKKYQNSGFDLSDLTTHDSFRKMVLVDKEPVGRVTLYNLNFMMMMAEVGYIVGKKFQDKGYGTKMVSHFLTEVFAKTELRKIIAHVHIDNRASQKLLEKLGFQKEGHLREHYVIGDKPCDELFYGLLRREFTPVTQS